MGWGWGWGWGVIKQGEVGISDLAMVPAGGLFLRSGVMIMCRRSNTDNGTGLGLSPL